MLLDGTEDSIKLLDFGIAKLTQDLKGDATTEGREYGTSLYLAPEQVAGAGAIDGRTDLFSSASLLFELATFRKAWFWDQERVPLSVLDSRGLPPAEAIAAMARIQNEVLPSARTFRDDVPEWFDTFLQDLAAKELNARLPTADRALARLYRNAPALKDAPTVADGEVQISTADIRALKAELQKAPSGVRSKGASRPPEAWAQEEGKDGKTAPAREGEEAPAKNAELEILIERGPGPRARAILRVGSPLRARFELGPEELRPLVAQLESSKGSDAIELGTERERLSITLSPVGARRLLEFLRRALIEIGKQERESGGSAQVVEPLGTVALTEARRVLVSRPAAPTESSDPPKRVAGRAPRRGLPLAVSVLLPRARWLRAPETARISFELEGLSALEVPARPLLKLPTWLAATEAERKSFFDSLSKLEKLPDISSFEDQGVSHKSFQQFLEDPSEAAYVCTAFEYGGPMEPYFEVELLLRGEGGRRLAAVLTVDAAQRLAALLRQAQDAAVGLQRRARRALVPGTAKAVGLEIGKVDLKSVGDVRCLPRHGSSTF
jgi:hypothetical protein